MLSGPRTKLLELFSLLVLARGAIGANLTDLEDLASEARILTGSKFGSAIVSKYNLNPQVILSYILPRKAHNPRGCRLTSFDSRCPLVK